MAEVEAEHGSLRAYFRDASRRQISLQQIADELGVMKPTAHKWLRQYGFKFFKSYVEEVVA
jgi:predicted DNA binding protein